MWCTRVLRTPPSSPSYGVCVIGWQGLCSERNGNLCWFRPSVGIHRGLRGFCMWSIHSDIQTSSFWSCYVMWRSIDRKLKHDLWIIVPPGRANCKFQPYIVLLMILYQFYFQKWTKIFVLVDFHEWPAGFRGRAAFTYAYGQKNILKIRLRVS